MIALAAVLAAVIDIRPNALSGDSVIALLALAMTRRLPTVQPGDEETAPAGLDSAPA